MLGFTLGFTLGVRSGLGYRGARMEYKKLTSCFGFLFIQPAPASVHHRIHNHPSENSKMQFSTLVLAAATSLLSIASAGQVNFYSDTNCQNYIGEAHPGGYQTTGYAISPGFSFPTFLSFLPNSNKDFPVARQAPSRPSG